MILCVMAALLVSAVPSFGQSARAVAVVDFVDETSDGRMIGAARMSADLAADLAGAAGGRLRVVPVETVRAAMAARGYGTREIFNTTKMMEIAAAVGADVIVTGRWMHLDADWITTGDPGKERILYAIGTAMIEVRVIGAPTRRVLLAESYSDTATGFGFSRPFLVLRAARQVLRQVALSVARTVP